MKPETVEVGVTKKEPKPETAKAIMAGDPARIAVFLVDEDYRTRRKWGSLDANGSLTVDGMGLSYPTQPSDFFDWEEESKIPFKKNPMRQMYRAILVRTWDTEPILVRDLKRHPAGHREHPAVLDAFKRGRFAEELSNASLQAQGRKSDLAGFLAGIPKWAWFVVAGIVAIGYLYMTDPNLLKDLTHLR